jgi:hypothetical protein
MGLFLLLLLALPFVHASPFMRPVQHPFGCDLSRGGAVCYRNGSRPACPADAGTPSALFGCQGELWRPTGRMQDYAFVGFGAGMKAIPRPPTACDVKRYGAVGDGVADDSGAVLRAIADCARTNSGKVVYFPPGRYVITRRIEITASVLLRGAGKDATTLYFPKSLAAIDRYTIPAGQFSKYAYGDGLIKFSGGYGGRVLGTVQGSPRRGATRVQVTSANGLAKNQWVVLSVGNPAGGSLVVDLMRGCPHALGSNNRVAKRNALRHVTRVRSVQGNAVVLERPLPWDAPPELSPTLSLFAPVVQNAGVEQLTVLFPDRPYAGHWREPGYNGIAFVNLAHSWVQSVRVRNADVSMQINCIFCTLTDVSIHADPGRAARDNRGTWYGHIGIGLYRSTDTLLYNFLIDADVHHSVSMASFTSGCVAKQGRASPGKQIVLDNHRDAPYGNLWQSIDVGRYDPSRYAKWFSSAGNTDYSGPNVAAFVTYWNIMSSTPIGLPRSFSRSTQDFGGWVNLVDVASNDPADGGMCSWWGENPRSLYPRDLHTFMKRTKYARLGVQNTY